MLEDSLQRPLPAALLAQGGAALVIVAARAGLGLGWLDSAQAFGWAQGLTAALLAWKLGARWWWLPIHLLFMPVALWTRRLGIAPVWYLLAFGVLLLTYWRTDRSQVPLYLSNAKTAAAMARLLPATPLRMIDLGCGDGGLLRCIARARPDCHFVGIEHAPLPWLLARVRSIGMDNLEIRYGDFWRHDLAPFDLAYAFLSPVPMAELWRKACAQMRPDALLVVNSFAVPGAVPERELILDDRRSTRLLCYRPRGGA